MKQAPKQKDDGEWADLAISPMFTVELLTAIFLGSVLSMR